MSVKERKAAEKSMHRYWLCKIQLVLIGGACALLLSCRRSAPKTDTSQTNALATTPSKTEYVNRNITVPACGAPDKTAEIKYKRLSAVEEDEFGFPFNLCLTGLANKTGNVVGSLQLFIDMHFSSSLKKLNESIQSRQSFGFGRQVIETFITDPSGKRGILEYSVDPTVEFNFSNDICKTAVTGIKLNMADVTIQNFPIGPQWFPGFLKDKIAGFGFSLVKFIDEAGLVNKTLIPFLNQWFNQNRVFLGCDKSNRSVFTFDYNFEKGSSSASATWFPPLKFLPPSLLNVPQ